MPNRPTVNILWFKRDLRLRDHAPIQAAIASGQQASKAYPYSYSTASSPP